MTDLVANPRLIGRERETRALTELLDRIHTRGAAIIIRGEAGIGKSSLIRSARDEARSAQISGSHGAGAGAGPQTEDVSRPHAEGANCQRTATSVLMGTAQ